eukprot:1350514-Prymnesium_polylepis.1
MKLDRTVGQVVDLDAEQVLHGSFVRHFPIGGERVHEGVVRAPLRPTAIGIESHRVNDLQVVDVDANGERISPSACSRVNTHGSESSRGLKP